MALFKKAALSISDEELSAFVGPRAATYLKFKRKQDARRYGWATGWLWSGFLWPLPWLAYRKQYLILIVLLAIIAAVFVAEEMGLVAGVSDKLGISVSAVGAILGKTLVLQRADRMAKQADALNLSGEDRLAFLRRKGGVSKIAGWIAGILQAIVFAFVILGVIVALENGVSQP